MANKEEVYYQVKSTLNKTRTFSAHMGKEKGKDINKQITITGQFPRPNPKLEKAGISFISEEDKKALEKDPGFVSLVEDGKFKIVSVSFEIIPPKRQKELNLGWFKKLQEKARVLEAG